MKPSTGETIRQLKVVNADPANEFLFDPAGACADLRRAQGTWALTRLRQRLAVVRRFRHLLAREAEAVARTADQNRRRPHAELLTAEIIPLAEACKFLEREAPSILKPRRIGRRHRPVWLGGVTSEIYREPFGLVLIIAPSNYPIFLPGVQLVQALAAGNAVLLKPGVGGKAAAEALQRLLVLAGLPASLLRVLPEVADAAQLAISAGVDKVFFTGAAATGAKILAELAPRAIPSAMELSGCDAVIIRADADLDLAVRAAVFGLRLNAGETCIAPRRVFVARSIATEFEGRLAQALSACGAAPLAPAAGARLLPLLLQALRGGAHLLAGKLPPDGAIIGPVVLAGAAPSLPLLREDIFAPLLTILTVADDAEAVTLANDCLYALGAAIFTRDEYAAHALAAQLNAGVVIINDLIVPTADARLPFGGRKRSGFGLTRGVEGLLELTTTKVVTRRRGQWRPHFDEPRAGDSDLFRAYLAAAHGGDWRTRLKAAWSLFRAVTQRKEQSR